jgi:hypothetical protein
VKVRLRRLSALTTLALLSSAPVAVADMSSSSSSNWAGYAAHRKYAQFRRVFASWTQPRLTCTPGQASYSAFWVGLGGYSVRSKALEQVGTEADCKASGAMKTSVWFELVPAPSRRLALAMHPGDRIRASVAVSGHMVEIKISNATSGRSARKLIRAPRLDLSSAEWIAEAPSACVAGQGCRTLPLANFGSTRFARAGAQLVGARQAAISSRRWSLTRITLQPGRPRFAGFHPGAATGEITPSALAENGSAFTVRYSALTPPRTPPMTRMFHAVGAKTSL